MMQKIIPSYEGEVWCISKHLLASSMRLFEVGTKALAAGDKENAYDLFNRSYDLYCIFWGLNMGMLTGSDVKWVKKKEVNKIEQNDNVPANDEDTEQDSKNGMSKLKNWVKKAVNCCIE